MTGVGYLRPIRLVGPSSGVQRGGLYRASRVDKPD